MGHGAMGGTAGRRGGSQGGTLTGGVPTALIQHATGMDSNACVIGLCWVMILINTRTSRRPQVNSVWIHQPHRWKNTDALPPSSTSLLVSDQFPVSNMQGMSWVPVEVLLTTGGTPKPNIHNTEPTAVKAPAAADAASNPQGAPQTPGQECWRCGQPGHIRRECPLMEVSHMVWVASTPAPSPGPGGTYSVPMPC
ncbi:uncharacterized protein LOC110961245 isoform X3 [Acanthochromis polyacanthus]|uniref:uncharacterized protein LOC110961245 isoform X3 n=1 Tax=Acanthochromis polyacanthus TaxID=80966 RepID=UPI0022341F08|nr:uncharacterized protein LOC110961245 isoform X3 [Acanthochromis polyacanthus]